MGRAEWANVVLRRVWRPTMHEIHRLTAEQHELAAHEHRTAAEHNEKGNQGDEQWHANRAMQYSDHAYKLAKEAQNKSGQMVTV